MWSPPETTCHMTCRISLVQALLVLNFTTMPTQKSRKKWVSQLNRHELMNTVRRNRSVKAEALTDVIRGIAGGLQRLVQWGLLSKAKVCQLQSGIALSGGVKKVFWLCDTKTYKSKGRIFQGVHSFLHSYLNISVSDVHAVQVFNSWANVMHDLWHFWWTNMKTNMVRKERKTKSVVCEWWPTSLCEGLIPSGLDAAEQLPPLHAGTRSTKR